jgi:hypothetical protein
MYTLERKKEEKNFTTLKICIYTLFVPQHLRLSKLVIFNRYVLDERRMKGKKTLYFFQSLSILIANTRRQKKNNFFFHCDKNDIRENVL